MRRSWFSPKSFPPNDPRVAIVRASYAAALVYRKRYSEAEALVQEGIAALEKRPKEACAAIGSSYNVLALVMWRQGRRDALSLQQHAVDTASACFGPDHPALMKLLNNLAITFSDMHKTAEAEATFQRAISLGERNVGSDDPFLANCSRIMPVSSSRPIERARRKRWPRARKQYFVKMPAATAPA